MNKLKDMQDMQTEIKYVEVKETTHGLRVLNDFNNLFGYNIKLPSETVGNFRKMTKAEIAKIYPEAYKYLDSVKSLTNYIKTHGGDVSSESFAYRVHHIQAMIELLDVTSRLQFIKALEDQIGVYRADNCGWGILKLNYEYKDGALVKTWVTLDDQYIDLSKPVRIQAIDWLGKLVDGIQLINRNEGKTDKVVKRKPNGELEADANGNVIYENINLPMNLAIQITEDSRSNQEHIERLYQRDGAINKSDMADTLLFSPLNYLVVRIQNDEADEAADIFPTGYDTPIFKVLDYSQEIPFLEHVGVLERYHQMLDREQFYNTREFSMLNILRWGIVDKATWDRGLSILNAVTNAPAVWGVDTPIDGKVVQWANTVIQDLKSRPENKDLDLDDVVVSGSSISKIANVQSQTYFRIRCLLVDKVTDTDIEFRDSYITFRYQKERTTKFQSLPRLTTDVYKIIECDKEGNMIRVVNPVDVFALVNHDITAVVVQLAATFEGAEGLGEVVPKREYVDYYNRISSFKDSDGTIL